MDGVDRVFHVAGHDLHARDRTRTRVFDVNVGGTRIVAEEALAAGVERLSTRRRSPRSARRRRAAAPTRRHAFTAGGLGIAYVNSKHEAEARGAARRRPGPRRGHRQPDLRARARRPRLPARWASIKRFLLRRIPAYVDGGLNIVDVRDVADGHLLADAKGERGERYILGGRNFTLQRLFSDLAADLGRSARPRSSCRRRSRSGRRARLRAARPAAEPRRRRDALGGALVDVLLGEGEAGARLRAAAARGDARGRARLADSTSSATASAASRAARSPRSGWPGGSLRIAGRLARL